MANFAAPTKVAWVIDAHSPWEQTFYPSLVKKINKSDAYFQKHFKIAIADLDISIFKNTFLPLYEQQIVSRPDYHLDEKETLQQLYKHMHQFQYQLLSVYERINHSFAGGIIFSIRDTYLSVALRIVNHDIRKQYKARTTIDYWMEPQLFAYAVKLSKTAIHHGKDIYPREEHAIGLTSYKMSLGAKPFVTKEFGMKIFSEKKLKKETASLFFASPDANGQLKKALLFHPTEDLKYIVQTLTALCSWSGIEMVVKQ